MMDEMDSVAMDGFPVGMSSEMRMLLVNPHAYGRRCMAPLRAAIENLTYRAVARTLVDKVIKASPGNLN